MAERDTIRVQRGEPYRRLLVVEQSDDAGVTWSRCDLAGAGFAMDIRESASEGAARLLSIRSTGVDPYAELETVAVADTPLATPDATGVISVLVPRDVVLASIPEGSTPAHDWAVVESGGDPVYHGRGPVIVDPRMTTLEA